MKETPAYYRARIDKTGELISSYTEQLKQSESEDVQERLEKNIRMLRNGVFPEKENEQELVKSKLKSKKYADTPLLFEEITRFNTWFAIYSEKIAGEEYVTTSREFPLMIKGNKDDIIKTINKGLSVNNISKKPVEFSFTASNIWIYEKGKKEAIEIATHNTKELLRLIRKYPNIDKKQKESLFQRLTDFYDDVSIDEKIKLLGENTGKEFKEYYNQQFQFRLKLKQKTAKAKLKLLKTERY